MSQGSLSGTTVSLDNCIPRYNRLSAIPETLANCNGIDEFNIEGNNVTELPVSNLK